MTASVLATGASGQLGRRVLELLLEQPAGPIIATTRRPEALAAFAARGVDVRRADFDDPASLGPAFRGARRALLISTDELGGGRRLAQQIAAVEALAAAGVEHVVYTSLPGAESSSVTFAPDHAGTEAALAASRLDYTILRNNIYADMLPLWIAPALATGKLVNARGDGALALITRDDCARIAAAALTSDRTGRHTFELTGPDALTTADLIALVRDVLGRALEHVRVPVDAVVRGMIDHGLPPHLAEIYGSLDVAIARGELGHVTGDAARLLGRAPTRVRDYFEAHRAQLAG